MSTKEELDQFEIKIKILWELYERIIDLMQSTNEGTLK